MIDKYYISINNQAKIYLNLLSKKVVVCNIICLRRVGHVIWCSNEGVTGLDLDFSHMTLDERENADRDASNTVPLPLVMYTIYGLLFHLGSILPCKHPIIMKRFCHCLGKLNHLDTWCFMIFSLVNLCCTCYFINLTKIIVIYSFMYLF